MVNESDIVAARLRSTLSAKKRLIACERLLLQDLESSERPRLTSTGQSSADQLESIYAARRDLVSAKKERGESPLWRGLEDFVDAVARCSGELLLVHALSSERRDYTITETASDNVLVGVICADRVKTDLS